MTCIPYRVHHMPHMKNKVIGIVGASGSGKSTLARHLASQLAGSTWIISQDHYYYGLDTDQDPETYNFDHPDALELTRLKDDLLALKSGHSVSIPCYDFSRHCRIPEKAELIQPAETIIVEGILLNALPERGKVLDLLIYVETDIDTCRQRRIERDTTERGRTVADVLRQFNEQVKPMHDRFVAPARYTADIIFKPHTFSSGKYEAQIRPLCERIQQLTQMART